MRDSLPTRDYTNLLMTNTNNIVGCIDCRLRLWSDMNFSQVIAYCRIVLYGHYIYHVTFAQPIVV